MYQCMYYMCNVCLSLKTCSRVMLIGDERKKFIDLLRRPNLSSLARKAIAKKISEKCKKVVVCPHCGGINGMCFK